MHLDTGLRPYSMIGTEHSTTGGGHSMIGTWHSMTGPAGGTDG